MECPRCHRANLAAARFCGACGKPLATGPEPGGLPPLEGPTETCPSCGLDVPGDNACCIACGYWFDRPVDQASRGHSSRPSLVHVLPDGEVPYPLGERTVLGRDAVEGVDIAFPGDAFVSRRGHAVVTREGDAYVLEDLGSSNGTFIRIRGEAELRPGDYIGIGGQVFRFMS